MIANDQPTCFPADVFVALSSADDGTVLDRAVGVHNPAIVTNRTSFCERVGVSYGDVVYQRIIYDESQRYDMLVEVGEQDTAKHVSEVHADALFTAAKGVGLMLPVADCIATVVYDPNRHYLALVHLGRHSSLTTLIAKTVEHCVQCGSDPADLIVWMSPSAHQSHYRMEYFDRADDPEWVPFVERRNGGFYLDLQGHNEQQFQMMGVLPQNIHCSLINTATSDNYFSHSQGDTSGRFAVLAMMC